MTDLLRQGSKWLESMREAHCSSPVTCRRPSAGSGQVVELAVSATFAQTECELEDDYGLRVTTVVTDFLIAAADFAPTFGEPEAGDRIEADGAVYEVMPLGGEGHWRWTDPYRITMRIHTKEVGAV